MKVLRALGVPCLLLVAAGCITKHGVLRTYEGPQRPLRDLAILMVQDNVMPKAVDGKEREMFKWFYLSGFGPKYWGEIQLEPGVHSVACRFERDERIASYRTEPVTLTQSFERGHVYELVSNADYLYMRWHPEIRHLGTLEEFARTSRDVPRQAHWQALLRNQAASTD